MSNDEGESVYVYEDMPTIFTNIYNSLSWGDKHCGQYSGSSGPGSFLDYNSQYISFLQEFINDNKIKVIVDVGCGDFEIGPNIYNNLDVYYFGYDVYEEIIKYDNNEHLPEYKYHFNVLDCYNNMKDLPLGDLCIIKDVFQYWSNNSINVFLNYLIKNRRFKYILIVNSCGQQIDNGDTVTGQYRELSSEYNPLRKFNVVKMLNYNSKEVSLIKV